MAFSFRQLTQNSDPRLERLNIFALMLAMNQFLYAPSLMLLAGPEGVCAWPVVFTAPAFAATPWLTSRFSLLARLWVPFVGILNTLLAQYVMGPGSGAWVFVLPSVGLASLLLRQRQRFYIAGLTVLAMGIFVVPPGHEFSVPGIAAAIARINAGSVIILTGFIGWLFAAEDHPVK